MANTLVNPKNYRGPLVGLEIEAYASVEITGAFDGEDEASPRSIRRVAQHLREGTGLPFRAILKEKDDEAAPGEGPPTSSRERPIWAVRSDYSLDPCGAPNPDYAVGIEVITPPLEPSLAAKAGRIILECMHSLGDFVPGPEAGVHINVSVPELRPEDAAGIMLLDPFRDAAPKARLECFADPLFDVVVESLDSDAVSPDTIPALAVGLARRSRGRHLTNVLPLITGRGYVEFRHLDSAAYFRNPGRAEAIAARAAQLLSRSPHGRIRACIREAISCVGRLRNSELGAAIVAAAAEARSSQSEAGSGPMAGNMQLLRAVLQAAHCDGELLQQFPWIASYPTWQLTPGRRRNRIRFPYAVACVDRDEVWRKLHAATSPVSGLQLGVFRGSRSAD